MILSSPSEGHSFARNALLATFPAPFPASLAALLRPTLFHLGDVLYEADTPSEMVCLPQRGILSLVLTSATGIEVEVGLIGPEGVAASADALCGEPNSSRCQVQMAGQGWRLPAAALRAEFDSNAGFRGVLLRYGRALSATAAQNVLCNRLHSVEQRLAKWLLLVQDRMHTEEMELTHEFIATMLGSRREAVTLSLGSLRDVGLISYRRGFVSVLDRVGLEALSCECYPLIRAQHERTA